MLAQNILTILALAFTVSSSPLIARQIKSSGNDGEGNQNVGNGGQNSGNGASNTGTINGDYTVQQATVTCGNAQLNCCNKVSKKGDTTNAGLLGAVFGSGDLDVQCSPLNIPIIGSASVLALRVCEGVMVLIIIICYEQFRYQSTRRAMRRLRAVRGILLKYLESAKILTGPLLIWC